MSAMPKRPMLALEDRARLRRMAARAAQNGEAGINRPYCRGVADLVAWLDGGEMSPMLKEMTR